MSEIKTEEAFFKASESKQAEVLRIIQIVRHLSPEEQKQFDDYLSRCDKMKST